MDKPASIYRRHRFNLSARDIEDLMAERGIALRYESIRLWRIKFRPKFAKRLQRRYQGYGDKFFIDEGFAKIQGSQHYIWRAVDQDGEVVDVFLQNRRDGKAAISEISVGLGRLLGSTRTEDCGGSAVSVCRDA